MNKLAVIGAGSWGTALSIVLAPKFHEVALWSHGPALAVQMRQTRENVDYLPGFTLPDSVNPTDSLGAALDSAEVVLFVVPSQYLRAVVRECVPYLRPSVRLVSASKGIEAASLSRMSELISEEISASFPAHVAILSGPTFAKEIALGDPAALVIASSNPDLARCIQAAFAGPTFRLYTNSDPAGVEIGAALKNVIAIGAGICQGLGLGHNAQAALVTRGLAEITRLALAAGGEAKTLAGLAGLGDLVLTCTGELSRNRKLGIELARGRKLPEILASTKTVAEGVETTYAAVQLAQRYDMEMPITEQMFEVLKRGKDPRQAIRFLMERSLKSE